MFPKQLVYHLQGTIFAIDLDTLAVRGGAEVVMKLCEVALFHPDRRRVINNDLLLILITSMLCLDSQRASFTGAARKEN